MATQLGTGTGTELATLIPDLTDTANIQTALKQLYYGTTGGTLSQTTGIYGALYKLYTGNPTLAGNVTITGTLTVNGSTTTINSTTLNVDDKLIELGAVTTPTNITADGGGISLFGTTNKTILWDNANNNWTTSENWNLTTAKTLKINNVDIVSGTGAALVLGANASTSLALGNTSGTTTLNGILSVNNPNRTMTHLMGYTSTLTAYGTTTLTNTSSYYQQFTGTSNQSITLPVTSTLATGWTFHIVNNSTASIFVQSSGLNAVITVLPGTTAMATCINTGVTDATGWEAGITDFSTYTGSGNVVMASTPTITTPVIDTINVAGSASTAALWNTTLTTGSISMGGALTTGVVNIATGTSFTSATGGQAVINIGTGAHTATTKTVNIGGAGVGGTLAVNLGSATGTSTTTVNGTFKVGVSTLAAGVTGTVTLPASAGTLALNNQSFFIGTQSIAINQGTGTITSLPGVSSINGATLPSSGTIITSSSPTITTPTIDTINTSLTTSGTVGLWNTGLTTGTISIGGALTTGAINIGSGTAGAKTITIGTSTGRVSMPNVLHTSQTANTGVGPITLTAAMILTTNISHSGQTAALAYTLDTGTNIDTGLSTPPTGTSIDWNLFNDNTSAGAITVSGGTANTLVGSGVVAIGAFGRFVTRKTATNTYITYRIA